MAILLTAMIGADPADAATANAAAHRRNYAAGLSAGALSEMRVGVIRPDMSADLAAQYQAALDVLKGAGAILVEVTSPKLPGLGEAELLVLQTELKADLNAYLATTPSTVSTRTLADVIAFNRAHAGAEMPFFGQETFEAAEKTKGLSDPVYAAARAKALRLAGAEGIDAMLRQARAVVLVQPTYGPAWLSDTVSGDGDGGPSSSALPAIAGYPNLTVPMGLVKGLPVGLSFIAGKYSETSVLGAGFAYEQHSHARVAPRYLPVANALAGLEAADR